MGIEYKVSKWEECEEKVKEIEVENSNRVAEYWFRGHASSKWHLDTTLERRHAGDFSFLWYYDLVRRIKPAIETFTRSTWHMPPRDEIQKWLTEYNPYRPGEADMLAPEYLSHLRHNGFPSPLMDWTSSLYVAAYFAFAKSEAEQDVAIYVYCERPDGMKGGSSNDPQIRVLGPYIKTHRRHFLQKSRYTVCAQYKNGEYGLEWHFASHEDVFDEHRPREFIMKNITNQDALWKIIIPGTERAKVLRHLDKYNVNAFSLFDSEESLMEMLATQEIDARK